MNPIDDDELSPEQRERLSRLETEIGFDKITSSFSIEGRTGDQKRSAFFSAAVSKQDGRAPGWTPEEAQVIACIVSKHVVRATFRDALARHVVGPDEAKKELSAILGSYDRSIAAQLKKLG